MKKLEQRDGNLEVLRIIAVFLIIFHHYACHGELMYAAASPINMWIGNFLYIGGKIGVHLFILITGYYMINSKFKIKKLLKIILQTVTYSVLVDVLFIYILKYKSSTINFWAEYWFVNVYIAIYLCSPFLNKFIKVCNKKEMQILIVLMFIVLQFYIKTEVFSVIYMYIIGATFRLYDFNFKKPEKAKWYAILGYITIFIAMIILYYLNKTLGNIEYRNIASAGSILVMFVSISMFLSFKNLKVKNNIVIQTLASSSLAVYLLHDHAFNRKNLWWRILCTYKVYFLSPVFVIIHAILSAIIIYLVAVLVELVRVNLIEKPIFNIKFLDKYFDKIDETINI